MKKINTSVTIKEIQRSLISEAEYNPRVITRGNRERLRKGLERFGLAEPLIWNERTGVLVGGHQRLSIMDEDNDYPNNDYHVAVSVVNLDEKDEATLNVQLNSSSMHGEFDIEKLNELLDFGVQVEELGFDDAEIDILFKDFEEFRKTFGDDENVEDAKSELEKIKEERAEMNKEKAAENSAAYYFTVICSNADEKEEILKLMGVEPFEEFVTAKQLRTISKVDF